MLPDLLTLSPSHLSWPLIEQWETKCQLKTHTNFNFTIAFKGKLLYEHLFFESGCPEMLGGSIPVIFGKNKL
jgi:hypothetical protein